MLCLICGLCCSQMMACSYLSAAGIKPEPGAACWAAAPAQPYPRAPAPCALLPPEPALDLSTGPLPPRSSEDSQ